MSILRPVEQVNDLARRIKNKRKLTDYDLGVLATLKWLNGAPDPLSCRVD